MKRFNLLPAELTRGRAGRQRRQRYSFAFAITGVAAALWLGLALFQVRGLSHQVRAAQTSFDRALARQEELKLQALECEKLRTEARVVENLQSPVPPTAVLALMTELAPDAIAFDELSFDAGSSEKTAPTRGAPQKAKSARQLDVHIRGSADDDGSLIQFMRKLNESPYLSGIRLEQTQPADSASATPDRGFSIFMQIGHPHQIEQGRKSP